VAKRDVAVVYSEVRYACSIADGRLFRPSYSLDRVIRWTTVSVCRLGRLYRCGCYHLPRHDCFAVLRESRCSA